MTRYTQFTLTLAGLLCTATGAAAQAPPLVHADVFSVAPVRDAPFSADATVLMKLTTFDGSKMEQTLPAKYYRDGMGRIRREQVIAGLTGLNPTSDTQSIVTIIDPVAGFIYTIVGNRREVQRMRIDARTAADLPAQLPGTPVLPGFSTAKTVTIGTRQIDGIEAVGHRMTLTIPAGMAGNEQPMEVIEERWMAVDLKVLLLSRHHNPRSGDVEYRLTNIIRAEPPKALFEVPPGYKVVDIPPRMDEHRSPILVR